MDLDVTVESYLAALGSAQKREFDRIRDCVNAVMDDTDLVISYGMPTFKYKGKVLLHFGAFKDHMSIFPGGEATEKFESQLRDFKTSKGTIQFTTSHTLPKEVITEIIKHRFSKIH